MTITAKHQILIVGGGTAGITVAARLLRKGHTDVAVIEPSDKHYYQPLWTLVGGGQAKASTTERDRSPRSCPRGRPGSRTPPRRSIRTATRSRAPTGRPTSTTCWSSARASSSTGTAPRAAGDSRQGRGVVELPVRPRTPHLGLHPRHALGHRGVHDAVRARSSAPGRRRRSPTWPPTTGASRGCSRTSTCTWSCRRRGCSAFRRSPTTWTRSSPDYGIHLHTSSEVTSVDAGARKVAVEQCRRRRQRHHAALRRAARRAAAVGAGLDQGQPAVDRRRRRATSTSTSTPCSTCATPTCSASVTPDRRRTPRPAPRSASRHRWWSTTSTRTSRAGRWAASYDGYSSCPMVTSSHAMLLAEFDYDLNLEPSFPLLNPTTPHRAYWYLKKYGLPFMYWNLMLKGLA